VKVSSTETPQDAALSNSVRDRLLLAKAVDLSAVKVVSSSGTVYLTGTVTSLDSRRQDHLECARCASRRQRVGSAEMTWS
jgi:osmotically-inducible protein OsmY